VKFGKANADIGSTSVADLNSLASSPPADEKCDFVIPEDRLDEPPVKRFLAAPGPVNSQGRCHQACEPMIERTYDPD
jgi:molybdate-binding protein